MPDVTGNWRRDHPWAAVYDFVVERDALSLPLGWLLFGTDTRLLARSLRAIAAVRRGGAILDVPCGGGVALRGLLPGQEVRYVAADISPAMLQRTAAVAAAGGLDQVESVQADAENLPFADGEFDLCLSFAGLHVLPHPDVAVREIARCLAPGGRFVGSMFVRGAGVRFLPLELAGRAAGLMGPGGTHQALRRWLADAGLEDITIERSGAVAHWSAVRPA